MCTGAKFSFVAFALTFSACGRAVDEETIATSETAAPVFSGMLTAASSCETDDDCFHTGCSGQICASEDVFTTCEYTCAYGCYAAASCGCTNGKCRFDRTRSLKSCLRDCDDGTLTGGGGGLTPVPVTCGSNTCEAGTYCCNSSCGICAPFGASCIDLYCSADE